MAPEEDACEGPVATFPTMQLSLLIDITGGDLSDYMALLLEPRKTTFFTRALVLPKNCKHTLMCTIGGVTL